MGDVATGFNTAFREYVVDGVPASGPNPPDKGEAKALGALIEAYVGPPATVATLVGAAQTLALDHANAWLELSHTAAITVTVPKNVDVAYPVPTSIFGAQAGVGAASFVGDTGVTILVADTQEATTACQGAVWELQKIATNTWRLFGNLAAV